MLDERTGKVGRLSPVRKIAMEAVEACLLPLTRKCGTMLRVVVTGGNSGIGKALCKQLASEYNCYVYMGTRSIQKGQAALEEIKSELSEVPDCAGRIEVVQLDVQDDASVTAAAAAVKAKLPEGDTLYALVNNAGTGLAHDVDQNARISTNYWGVKKVTAAFMPLLGPGGRIVNVGSGAGPMFVGRDGTKMTPPSAKTKTILCSMDSTIDEIENIALKEGIEIDGSGYGISKACLAAYTAALARSTPTLTLSCITPGFIDTAITKGFGSKKAPEEGTVAIRHCLFGSLALSGAYYGSDGVRSPLHFMRSPGMPAYDGVPPTFE